MESVFYNGGMIGATLDFGATDRYVVGPATLQYVGGTTLGFVGTTANTTVSLSGITMQQNDLVIIAFATGSTAARSITASTYTQVALLYANDTFDTNLYVGYKFMGSTPDTSITLTGGTLNTADAGTVAVHVWRNVDTTTPLDVTRTTSTSTNTVIPTPPAITPITSGAVVLAAYAGGFAATGNFPFTNSNGLSNFLTVAADDTNDVAVGLGSLSWTSGALTPPRPSVSGDNTQWSSAAVTLALRPSTIFGNLKNSGVWNIQAAYEELASLVSGVSVEYIGVTDNGVDGTTFAFNGVNIGTASSDRIVVVVIETTGASSGTTKTALTINGNAMTDVHSISDGFGNTNVAYYKLATGTTADISITLSGTKNRSSCAVYTVKGQSVDTPSDTASGTTPSLTVDLPQGSAGIFSFGAISTTVTTTWSGATEDLDQAVGGEGTTSISTARASNQTTAYTVTTTHSATPSNPVYTATVWS